VVNGNDVASATSSVKAITQLSDLHYQATITVYPGMALAHSRRPSMGLPRRPPRITITVIRPAANTAMSHAGTSLEIFSAVSADRLGCF